MLLTMKQDDSPYYTHLRELNLSPGWARPEPSMWPSPQPKFKPAVWRFADAKKALDASHNMVPADQTERRNLILVNPIEGNTYATTRHLVAAYQCVMPGDRARTHRHSAAALRLVLHGKEGVYTIVNGTRIDMLPGEVLLTPAWCWHGHVNETRETGYWIDFLDIPFVQLTEAMFFEPYPQGGLEAITSSGPTPMRIPAREALGRRHRRQDGRDRQGRHADHRAQSDPAAEGRQGRDAEDDRQHHLRGGVRQGALHRRGLRRDRRRRRRRRHAVLARAHASRRRRIPWCSRCPTIRSSRSSGSREPRIELVASVILRCERSEPRRTHGPVCRAAFEARACADASG